MEDAGRRFAAVQVHFCHLGDGTVQQGDKDGAIELAKLRVSFDQAGIRAVTEIHNRSGGARFPGGLVMVLVQPLHGLA